MYASLMNVPNGTECDPQVPCLKLLEYPFQNFSHNAFPTQPTFFFISFPPTIPPFERSRSGLIRIPVSAPRVHSKSLGSKEIMAARENPAANTREALACVAPELTQEARLSFCSTQEALVLAFPTYMFSRS